MRGCTHQEVQPIALHIGHSVECSLGSVSEQTCDNLKCPIRGPRKIDITYMIVIRTQLEKPESKLGPPEMTKAILN